jgi:hypothetical protein
MSVDELVTVNEDGTTTVTLRRPITHRDKEIETVKFPVEATVAHLEASDKGKGDIEKSIHMIAAMIDVPVNAIRKMNAQDFNRLATVVNGLVGKDQAIGGTL